MSNQPDNSGNLNRRELLSLMGTSMLTIAAGTALMNHSTPKAYATALENGTSEPEANEVPTLQQIQATLPTIAYYNVKDFGAIGDGLADDTNAIQEALSLASSVSGAGSLVWIPKGTYKLTDTLRLYANTHLKLDQNTTLVRHHDRSFLINGDWYANYSHYDGQGNIIIEGGTWEGNISQYPNDYNCFGLARGRNIIVRNLEVRDVVTAHAIDMNACEDVRIENCRFLGYRDGTVDQSRNYAEAIQLANHTSVGFSDMGGHDGTPCRNISVINCYFGASGTPGTGPWPAGVGNHYAVYNLYNSNFTIENNTFDGMSYAGVRSFKFSDLKIVNNTFNNCYRGVQLSNPAANTESSKDQHGVQSGMPQSSYNILVTGNIFNHTVTEHIYCVGWPKSNSIHAKVQSVSITNNVFNNNSNNSAAVFMKWVNQSQICHNQFLNVYRGIYLAYTSDTLVSNNQMQQITTEGLFVEEPDSAYANNNHTTHLSIHHNTMKQCGRTAINIRAVNHFQVHNNLIEAAGIESDNTRHGIQASSGARNGSINQNLIVPAAAGNKNQYGIHVTSTCDNIQLSNNQAKGKTRAVLVEGTSNVEGFYMYSPNGTAYLVSVSNTGSLVFTTNS